MTEKEKQELLHDLFVEHYKALESLAYHLCNSLDLAEDIVQDTFVVAQARFDVLLTVENKRAWLYKVMRNVIGDAYRRRKQLSVLQTQLLQQYQGSYQDELNVRTLYEGAISDDDLQLLFWIYCERRSYAEIAASLEVSVDACKKRVQRAKERFRKTIENENT